MVVVELDDKIALNDGEVLSTLDKELRESQEDQGPAVPEKFKGKSLDDIINAYTNLEQEYGRRSNEIGELRKLTDNLLGLKLEQKEEKEEPPKPKITTDDLFTDPEIAIERAVQENPKLRALEEKLLHAEREQARQKFEAEHNDWQQVMASDGFQTWVKSSPVLLNALAEADKNFDYQTGADILRLYKSVHQTQQREKEEVVKGRRERDLKAMATERGGSGEAPRKIYSRVELLKLRQHDPERFDAMHDEIMRAYKEGRVK